MVLAFESVDEILKSDHSNQSSSTGQYFPVLFSMRYKTVLCFESVD